MNSYKTSQVGGRASQVGGIPLTTTTLSPSVSTRLWYQSHSFLAGDSVVVILCLSVCVYPKLWCSVVVSPSYRRWRHPSRKVNS